MATYFHAWRRRQADRQVAEWLEERTEARLAVAEAPAEIRDDVRRAVDTLLEGADGEVEPALNELWNLLDRNPQLRERFARLRVVADAIDFVKTLRAGADHPKGARARPRAFRAKRCSQS